ncbi:MAG: pyrroline-5-carboxylate reductase family protein [Alphaproteobacteria bacterium]
MTVLIIGCGNLGEIILNGLLKKKKKVVVFDKRKIAINKNKLNFEFVNNLNDVTWNGISIIMICVKPIDSMDLIKKLKNNILSKHIIMSFVAGLKVKKISKIIGNKCTIVRVMPNIFMSSGNSATGFFSEQNDKTIRNKISKLFEYFGLVIWLDNEKKLDFFTAMLGGGPAYFLFILFCFSNLFKINGFKSRESLELLETLMKGVLVQIKSKNFNFQKTIEKVASKGGTTEEALKVFAKNDQLFKIITNGIKAASLKSRIISSKIR